MESYLKGRGFDQQTEADSSFSPYLSPSTATLAATSSENIEVGKETQSQCKFPW
jgi:hypothetical protein